MIEAERGSGFALAFEARDQPRGECEVSERRQPGETHADLQPQQSPHAQQADEVVVDDSGIEPTYANFCRVISTSEEMILDFGLNPQPFTAETQVIKSNHRIVMSIFTTKRLLAALGMTIQRHEQTFGPIELDVNRRVSPSQPRFAPAEALDPTDQPQVIGLN
jgi:hypothetical protein